MKKPNPSDQGDAFGSTHPRRGEGVQPLFPSLPPSHSRQGSPQPRRGRAHRSAGAALAFPGRSPSLPIPAHPSIAARPGRKRGGAAPTPSAGRAAGAGGGGASAGKRLRGRGEPRAGPGRAGRERAGPAPRGGCAQRLPLRVVSPSPPSVIFRGNNGEYQRLFAQGPLAGRGEVKAARPSQWGLCWAHSAPLCRSRRARPRSAPLPPPPLRGGRKHRQITGKTPARVKVSADTPRSISECSWQMENSPRGLGLISRVFEHQRWYRKEKLLNWGAGTIWRREEAPCQASIVSVVSGEHLSLWEL